MPIASKDRKAAVALPWLWPLLALAASLCVGVIPMHGAEGRRMLRDVSVLIEVYVHLNDKEALIPQQTH